jgi:type IV pilus assembly protein PilC
MPTPAELEKILKQRNIRNVNKVQAHSFSGMRFGHRIKKRAISDFTRQLSTMIGARLPLTRSLEILEKQQKNKHFKYVIGQIIWHVQGGKSLSESLIFYPKLFGPLFVNMLKVGEVSGNLSEILEQLAFHLEKMVRLRRKIVTAMTYPAVVVVVAIGAISFLLFGVMPAFTDMFEDFGARMPLPARVLIGTANFARDNILILILALICIIILFKMYTRTEKGSWFFDISKFKIPLVGNVIKKVSVARFSRTLGTLLGSGVSLLDALNVTANSSDNLVVKKQILAMKTMAAKGEPMEKSIAKSAFFPDMVVQMIAVGEETAELPVMLTKTAEFYESEVDAAIESLTSIIEPVIIVVLGIIIGGTIITIYMQIFDLMNVIQ